MAVDEDDQTAPEPDIDDLDATEAEAQRLTDLADEHGWVASAVSVLAACYACESNTVPVQSAIDRTMIAACQRLERALRADLG
jgi:hypothetical protein